MHRKQQGALITPQARRQMRICQARTGNSFSICAMKSSIRMAHRNSNVQLYALSLADRYPRTADRSGEMNRAIASKAFIQGLEKLVTDRLLKVRKSPWALLESILILRRR
ncbi:hypothetical protein M378DRAFT_381403 [Amanita muscaria Koide BX008]|uniref:Uncharacterized protein n=1 Tax=Amanita muscaria (strain Koide BX008) TaxID=946122 RepID=A0A0C2W8P1_AMAMK|nr:hypothetical protein M378DRAFT_381403 [Amanita muscaria Koide BX008]